MLFPNIKEISYSNSSIVEAAILWLGLASLTLVWLDVLFLQRSDVPEK